MAPLRVDRDLAALGRRDFAFAIPRIASYSAVIDIFRQLTWRELWSLLVATGFNLFTYWLANMAALPGLRLAQAAVITQTTTTVANTLPAGGAVAVGLTYEMLHSWGFNRVESTLYIVVTGIWNIFMKLALPVASVAILAITGVSSAAFVTAALLGLLSLAVAVVLFALVLWREELARRLGDLGERVVSSIVNVFHRPRVTGLAESAVRFRRETIGLIRRRWWWLTGATILGHLALFLVLLLSLRHVGVSEAEISTAQAFAVFAFGRLISALPITPGGLGVIELGYIGGLVAAGGPRPQVVAAVFLFRVLTYGIQIPLGGITYLIWRSKRSWLRPVEPVPAEGARVES